MTGRFFTGVPMADMAVELLFVKRQPKIEMRYNIKRSSR
jgi:hypothetical protein